MRKAVALLAGVVFLVLANYTIYSKETLLADGQVVLLELAPVDPRSLMQGDYMALRFRVEEAVLAALGRSHPVADGHVVLARAENGVGHFVRIDNGSALTANELLMRFRVRDGEVKFATHAFFFQEGTAERYANARFGEFRVNERGEAILTSLRN
jgi:uncharacterized membrane-anchored protein